MPVVYVLSAIRVPDTIGELDDSCRALQTHRALFCGNAPKGFKSHNMIWFTYMKSVLAPCCQKNGKKRDKNRKRETTFSSIEINCKKKVV